MKARLQGDRSRRRRHPLIGWSALVLLSGLLLAGSTSVAAPLRAGSICEAQKLKARKALDPRIEIEIPPEFDQQFPSLDACLSHEEAWNENNAGPRQPIPFSHKHHAGKFKIDCQYCHSGTGRSQAAGVPAIEVCMGCHQQFPPGYDELEGIRILKEHWKNKQPIEWKQIHRLPEYVQFRHNRHIAFGLTCQRCHGPVEKMDRVYLVPWTGWKYFVPAAKLEMGWCVQCHNQEEHHASVDCQTCHY